MHPSTFRTKSVIGKLEAQSEVHFPVKIGEGMVSSEPFQRSDKVNIASDKLLYCPENGYTETKGRGYVVPFRFH
jgi:hypothetical protein